MKILVIILALNVLTNFTYCQDQSDSSLLLNAVEQKIKWWEAHFQSERSEKEIEAELNSESKGFESEGYEDFLYQKFLYQMTKKDELPVNTTWKNYINSRVNRLSNSDILPAANWISMGPNTIDSNSGRIISHAFDPTNPEILWIGSNAGGIWRTTNGGASWQSMTNELPSMIISDIEIKPDDRNIILAGTGNDRYFGIALGPGAGVIKSTDNGLTWNPTGFSYPVSQGVSVSKIVWKTGSQDTVFMAASNGLWISTNAGDNWQLLLNGGSTSIVINKSSPNLLYAAMRNNGIYRSTNGGGSWTIMANDLPSGNLIGLTALAICDSSPENVYVSITNASTFMLTGLYRTSNSGENWTQVPNVPNVSCVPQYTQCYGWYVNALGVSPHNPELIFIGGLRFARTSNGGATWTQHDPYTVLPSTNWSGLSYVDIWDVAFHPSDPNIVYVFDDGGVQKSTNGGLWWNKINNNLVTGLVTRIASSSLDTNIMIAGFQDHGLQRLDNSGGNTFWKRWSFSDGMTVIIHPENNNIFYGDFYVGNHNRSLTGGINWPQTTTSINNGITESGVLIAPLIMHPQNHGILYTASTAKIYRTISAGSSWEALANIPNVTTMAIDRINPDIIYADAYDNSTWAFWKSTNGGMNWNRITNPTIPTWRVTDLEVDPSNSGVIYATRNSAQFNQDHIKKSTDFGETWTNITSDLPDIFVNAITISPLSSSHLYIATDLGVYASTNGGANWFEFNDNLPVVQTFDIHYHPIDRTIRIATMGRGVWKTKALDAAIGIEGNNSTIPVQFKLYQNYPNPFNPSTTIQYDLSRKERVKIEIYNSIGQKVNDIKEEIENAGTHSITWNAVNTYGMSLPSGIYFLKFTAGSYTKTIKMNYVK